MYTFVALNCNNWIIPTITAMAYTPRRDKNTVKEPSKWFHYDFELGCGTK